jgi:glycosyltransferase involved in cell wall biosynthesis
MKAGKGDTPTVSVGLPVFNGADYVAEAIASILGQTYGDFELLIQDNASTDRTGAICREFARRDSRVSYIRNPENLGAIPNYNLVFERARGRYFKWAAHDDICAPTFLERCVEVLDADSSVVLCSGQTRLINDDGSPVFHDRTRGCFVTRHGAPVGIIDPEHRAEGTDPAKRFWDVLVRTMRTFEIFGLIRSDVLLYRRCHPSQSSLLTLSSKRLWSGGGPRRQNWLSLRLQKVVPGYVHVVRQAPIRLHQKLLCYGAIAYRLVAPQTWIKQFAPGRYTET